jgi:hypothetical protein
MKGAYQSIDGRNDRKTAEDILYHGSVSEVMSYNQPVYQYIAQIEAAQDVFRARLHKILDEALDGIMEGNDGLALVASLRRNSAKEARQ